MSKVTVTHNLKAALAKEIIDQLCKTKVAAITCPLCHCTIYSRARHDFRYCKCGAVSIDGGFNYTKCAWDDKRVFMPETHDLFVDTTKEMLYEDWNQRTDKFGLIESKKESKHARAFAARTNRSRVR